MDQPQKPDESQDESLAAIPPMPLDEARAPAASSLALGAVVLTAAGAGAILLISATMTPAMGATRSTKLQWEVRRLQIEQAERDVQGDSKANAQQDANSNHAEQD